MKPPKEKWSRQKDNGLSFNDETVSGGLGNQAISPTAPHGSPTLGGTDICSWPMVRNSIDEFLNKAKVYLKPGEKPPQNISEQIGPEGGRYYESVYGQLAQPAEMKVGKDRFARYTSNNVVIDQFAQEVKPKEFIHQKEDISYALDSLPKTHVNLIKRVVIENEERKKEFVKRWGKSVYMTASAGGIRIYPIGGSTKEELASGFAHELGHLVADALFEDMDPSIARNNVDLSMEYERAVESDASYPGLFKPTNMGEDFAEAYRQYFVNPNQEKIQNRLSVIKKIVENYQL